MSTREYNGHRNRNAWNVSLWFSNDRGLYDWGRESVREMGIEKAARYIAEALEGSKTPDGARYNYTCIREALRGICEDIHRGGVA